MVAVLRLELVKVMAVAQACCVEEPLVGVVWYAWAKHIDLEGRQPVLVRSEVTWAQ